MTNCPACGGRQDVPLLNIWDSIEWMKANPRGGWKDFPFDVRGCGNCNPEPFVDTILANLDKRGEPYKDKSIKEHGFHFTFWENPTGGAFWLVSPGPPD